jgi:hypothetical protein
MIVTDIPQNSPEKRSRSWLAGRQDAIRTSELPAKPATPVRHHAIGRRAIGRRVIGRRVIGGRAIGGRAIGGRAGHRCDRRSRYATTVTEEEPSRRRRTSRRS